MKVAAKANLHHKAVSAESHGPFLVQKKKTACKSYEHALKDNNKRKMQKHIKKNN